jgi:DNA-binding IclR family transcriptional regulator
MCFTEQRPNATVDELAKMVGVPLSTAYRYVSLLREVGLVEEDRNSGFVLSSLVVPMARAARAANPLLHVAEPIIRKLSENTNETVLLLKRMDTSAVCIARVDSTKPIRLSFEIGRPVSLTGGAASKILLSAMPKEERRRFFDELKKDTRPPNGLSKIEKELESIERNQWAVSSGELDEGIWAAAAAVTDGKEVQAALTVAGLAAANGSTKQKQILAQVRKSAAEISERIAAFRL